MSMKKKTEAPNNNKCINNAADVIIVGAGMAGLTLASLLGQNGMDVLVVDREDPQKMADARFDSRTVALSAGTRNILLPLGFWQRLAQHGQPIHRIDVQEGHDPFILNFDTAAVGGPFGWILPNDAVRQTLYESCMAHRVRFQCGQAIDTLFTDDTKATLTLADGMTLSAPLVIAADGRNSTVRALLGIDVVALEYDHTAFVGLITHEQPHEGLALERFYTSGPFATLPFTDDAKGRHRSAIVWSRHTRDLKHDPVPLHDLHAVTKALQPLLKDRFGTFEAVGTWAAYPLSLRHAKTMTAQRVALISDAAHAIHPIAGQGLNLGMRDIAWLAQHLPQAQKEKRDWGSPSLLADYNRARRFDVFTMVAATDLLTRLFGNRLPPVRWARSLGLGLVDKVPPLKRFFMKQAMGG